MKALAKHLRESRSYVENSLDVMKDAKASDVFKIDAFDHRNNQRQVLKMIECLESVLISGNVVLIQRFEEILNK